ncbi:MAG: 6-phosphogluconolactonase [Spirochaetaceae bacterium]|nr:6-phosphogluconolactonase [Spirochaetaceae bacterium]
MPIRVFIAKDYDHMSAIAADFAKRAILRAQKEKPEAVLGLATGNSPVGLYRLLARAANAGEYDPKRVRSFNLDEYIGLPGDNAQERILHPESYSYFMIQEFFSLLKNKFAQTCMPYGSLVEQERFEAELDRHPDDWRFEGRDAGKSVVIKDAPASEYLGWIKDQLQGSYESKIKTAGGIDLQVIGSGGKGHVAFHESGIPFEGSRVLVVKLDDNTIRNAVADGHFADERSSPRFAISMGAELVYEAKCVLMLACGERKRAPIARSLLEEASPAVPISYGQIYAKRGGDLIYVVDAVAGADLIAAKAKLAAKGIELVDAQ